MLIVYFSIRASVVVASVCRKRCLMKSRTFNWNNFPLCIWEIHQTATGKIGESKALSNSARRCYLAKICGSFFVYFTAITDMLSYFSPSALTEAHLDDKNIPTALRESEIWRKVQDDEPVQDIVLASPTYNQFLCGQPSSLGWHFVVRVLLCRWASRHKS